MLTVLEPHLGLDRFTKTKLELFLKSNQKNTWSVKESLAEVQKTVLHPVSNIPDKWPVG